MTWALAVLACLIILAGAKWFSRRRFEPPKETISERTRTEWMRDRRI